jgi:hypothetical protein
MCLLKGSPQSPLDHSQPTPLPTHPVTDKTKSALLQIWVNNLCSLFSEHDYITSTNSSSQNCFEMENLKERSFTFGKT